MKNAVRTCSIGSYRLENPVGLAPMAGTSDLIYRSICHEMGSQLAVTELVTARGIRYDTTLKKSYRYLEIDPEKEGPCAIQLFGYEPEDFSVAIPAVLEHPKLSAAAFLDINMGCPVTKVVKTGAGSALMRTPRLAADIIRAAVEAVRPFGIPVGVKFRKGWDAQHINAADFAKVCVEAGASVLCVHARTREQMYSGDADWDILSQVVCAVSGSGVPVLGNGDVKDGVSAKRMFEETGVDGIMVGRAALGNPWIFREISDYLCGRPTVPPSLQERVSVLLRHLHGQSQRIGEPLAIREMRSQMAYYLKGLANASSYKDRLMHTESIAEAEEVLSKYLIINQEAF